MERDDVIARLRAMARQPIDEATVSGHLAGARAAADNPGRHWGRVAVVAACLLMVAAPAAALATRASDEPAPTDIGEVPDESPADEEEFSCTGPPPFAGETPEGETEEERAANREAEAEAFAAWREENCPDDAESGVGPPDGLPPVAGECAGPPPFAEVPADPADPAEGVVPSPRADEATTMAETRAACADDAGEEAPPSTTQPAPEPPSGPPAGPPDGVPGGPGEETPDGPPAGTPAGPPEGTPAGPPEWVPRPGGGG